MHVAARVCPRFARAAACAAALILVCTLAHASAHGPVLDTRAEEYSGALWAVKLHRHAKAHNVAADAGCEVLQPVEHLSHWWVLLCDPNDEGYIHARLHAHDDVRVAERHTRERLAVRQLATDPRFADQWNLFTEDVAEVDCNLEATWEAGATGAGVVVAVVDDGVDYRHADLAARYTAAFSHDYNDRDADPLPTAGDTHGTAMAGIVAATRNNDVCGSGVAPGARIAGVRLLAGSVLPLEVSAALGSAPLADVYLNGWGPTDNGRTRVRMSESVLEAMAYGAANGRAGRGSVYVWAVGNGAEAGDDANMDGYASTPYSLTVGSVNALGKHAYYSEWGSTLFLTAPTGAVGSAVAGADKGVVSVVSNDTCVDTVSGTSSAAAQVAGVVALLLEVRPELTWRDVRWVLARSAVRIDATDVEWDVNKADPPMPISHKYGYGMVHVDGARTLAQSWALVPKERVFTSARINAGITWANGAVGSEEVEVSSFAPIAGEETTAEFVMVRATIRHDYTQGLEVKLVSPSGTVSILSRPHQLGAHTFIEDDASDHVLDGIVAADFGAAWEGGGEKRVTAPMALVRRASLCSAPVGDHSLVDAIAIVDRSSGCSAFAVARHAEESGAVAVLVDTGAKADAMGGVVPVGVEATIPVFGVSSALRTELEAGASAGVNITLAYGVVPQRDFVDWRFGTARLLGETLDGRWELRISDQNDRAHRGGTLESWTLTAHYYGDSEVRDPAARAAPAYWGALLGAVLGLVLLGMWK